MANVTITDTTTILEVDFGVYSASFGVKKENWHKHSIHFKLVHGDAFIKCGEDNGSDIAISWDGSGNSYQVDTVNGVAPTSNADLYDKLVALL
jgi:hypothetical protein